MQSPLAYEGLTEEIELGALLPCNVIVYENDDGDIVVSAVDPEQLVGIADNDALRLHRDRGQRAFRACSRQCR